MGLSIRVPTEIPGVEASSVGREGGEGVRGGCGYRSGDRARSGRWAGEVGRADVGSLTGRAWMGPLLGHNVLGPLCRNRVPKKGRQDAFKVKGA